MSDSPDTDESTERETEPPGHRSEDAAGPGADDTTSTNGAAEVSPEELDEIEAERKERLDPDNRPENAEVDNTDRDFDTTIGQFTDHEPDPDLGPFADPE